MTPRRPKPGFTLAELVVTLTITVLLSGATVALLRSLLGARGVIEHRLQGEAEAAAALQVIATTLRNAYRPISARDALFVGEGDREGGLPADRVRFRAVSRETVRAGQAEGEVREVEFYLRREGKLTALMRRTDPTRNAPPDGGGVAEALAHQVVGLGFEYFDGQHWQEKWPESQQRWPDAVRVRLVYVADTETGRLGEVRRLVNFPAWAQAGGGPPPGGGP